MSEDRGREVGSDQGWSRVMASGQELDLVGPLRISHAIVVVILLINNKSL